MAEPNLKLVDNTPTADIDEIAGQIATRRKERKGNGGDNVVLPPEGSPRYNDLANADRFLAFVGDDLLYCIETEKWLLWQGTHWAVDTEDFIFQIASDFARSLFDGIFLKEALANAQKANNAGGLLNFLKLAARQRSVSISTFDCDAYSINCKNGTLDLRTGALRPHAREDRITRIVNTEYEPNFRSPIFERFLSDIQPDPSIRAFLQKSVGYSLLGVVRERAFWILYGMGNNGKSVFLDTFNSLLGEYGTAAHAASFMAAKSPNAIQNDIARLKGSRFIIVSETEENERINASFIKALSAGDTVTARFLFAEFFNFAFTGTLWIATNHKPIISDSSDALWQRVKLVPFTTTISADRVIKKDDLMRMLLGDAPALFAWAVQGCRDYFEIDGFDTPQVIRDEIATYRYEQDSIAQFISERCETLDEASAKFPDRYHSAVAFTVSNADLYRAYKKFCDENGEYLRSHRRLSQNMRERGFQQIKSGARYWEGLRLLDTL